MPCIKRETNVVKNDKEKRTKGLSDFVAEAKSKIVLPKPTSFVNEIHSQL